MNSISPFRCSQIILCILACILSACVTPKQPIGASDPSGIAWVGNKQSAGFIHDSNGLEIWVYDSNHNLLGGEVYPQYVERYNDLWNKVGVKELAPKNPFTFNGTVWIVSAEGAQSYMAMNRAAK